MTTPADDAALTAELFCAEIGRHDATDRLTRLLIEFRLAQPSVSAMGPQEPAAYRVISKRGFTRGIYEHPTEQDFAIWFGDGDTVQRLYAAAPETARPERDAVTKALAFLRSKLPSHGTHGEEMLNAFECISDALKSPPEERREGKSWFGNDCPKGMVQVEFVGVDPKLKYSEYGWKPSKSAFLEVWVDGQRFRIDVGDMKEYSGKDGRGIHINYPFQAEVADQCANALTLLLPDAAPMGDGMNSVPQGDSDGRP